MERATGEDVNQVSPHCLASANFLKNEKGFRIVDYGDSTSREMTFPKFIGKWQKELTEILTKGGI